MDGAGTTGSSIRVEVALASGLLKGLEERVERALDVDFPSSSAGDVAGRLFRPLLQSLTRRLDAYMARLEQGSPDGYPPLSSDDITLVTRSSALLGELVRYVEGARVDYTPWGLVHQVEAFVRTLFAGFGLDAVVIVRPRWKYNWSSYGLRNAFAEAVRAYLTSPPLEEDREISSVIEDAPNVLVLSFPSSERDNTLWYATWGHEIGHFLNVALRFEIREDATDTPPTAQASPNEEHNNAADEAVDSEEGHSDIETEEELETFAIQLANRAIFDDARLTHLAELLGDTVSDVRENRLRRRLAQELEHSVADLWSIHVLGPCALYVTSEVTAAVLDQDWRGFEPHDPHPPMWFRVELMLEELRYLGYLEWLGTAGTGGDGWTREFEDALKHSASQKLAELEGRAKRVREAPRPQEPAEEIEGELLDVARREACQLARQLIRGFELPSRCTVQLLSDRVFRLATLLAQGTPPNEFDSTEPDQSRLSFPITLNAAWMYWLSRVDTWNSAGEDRQTYMGERLRTNRLTLKALQSREAQCWYLSRLPERPSYSWRDSQPQNVTQYAPSDAGLLGKEQILARLNPGVAFRHRLVVNPLLNSLDQVRGSAIDIRLGNEFVVSQRMRLPVIDPVVGERQVRRAIRKYQYHVYINFGEFFVLHPQQFALGATLEFIGMPVDLSAVVVGRSSWGRLGLVIATATKVDPGFRGCVTLELLNLGDSPLMIYPGITIGQLLLYKMSGEQEYSGRYDVPIGPEFSKIYNDQELYVWGNSSAQSP